MIRKNKEYYKDTKERRKELSLQISISHKQTVQANIAVLIERGIDYVHQETLKSLDFSNHMTSITLFDLLS
jgi:hypothetical protein